MKKEFNAWDYDVYSGILDAIKTFKVYVGMLDARTQDGKEGYLWILREYGKLGRAGEISVSEGDHLVIYGKDGSVIFDETIRPEPPIGAETYSYICIHWTQKGVSAEKWADFFIRPDGETPYRAVLLKRKKVGAKQGT